jgi:hypothetical protein
MSSSVLWINLGTACGRVWITPFTLRYAIICMCARKSPDLRLWLPIVRAASVRCVYRKSKKMS